MLVLLFASSVGVFASQIKTPLLNQQHTALTKETLQREDKLHRSTLLSGEQSPQFAKVPVRSFTRIRKLSRYSLTKIGCRRSCIWHCFRWSRACPLCGHRACSSRSVRLGSPPAPRRGSRPLLAVAQNLNKKQGQDKCLKAPLLFFRFVPVAVPPSLGAPLVPFPSSLVPLGALRWHPSGATFGGSRSSPLGGLSAEKFF